VGEWHWDFNPRRVIEMILQDEIGTLIKDYKIWLCTACHTCSERCPQAIEVSEMMVQLKNAAARMGNIPENEAKVGREILKTGWAQSPGKKILQIRQELELPEMSAGIRSSELLNLIDSLDLPEQLRIRKKKKTQTSDSSAEHHPKPKKEKSAG
jgi:heterodisulfide reductase subunit C